MSYFKLSVFILLLFTISIPSYSQVDTLQIDADTTEQIVQLNKILPRKRGVYKTYEEYLTNSHTIDVEFTLKVFQVSKKNTLIAEAYVKYKNNLPKNIWGISDGENVFVRVRIGYIGNNYFRLQCDGPSPFYYLSEKIVKVKIGLGLDEFEPVADKTSLPPLTSIHIVKNKTDYMEPSILATYSSIAHLLKEYPDLLKAFENEKRHNKPIKIKYLSEYNKRKMAK